MTTDPDYAKTKRLKRAKGKCAHCHAKTRHTICIKCRCVKCGHINVLCTCTKPPVKANTDYCVAGKTGNAWWLKGKPNA